MHRRCFLLPPRHADGEVTIGSRWWLDEFAWGGGMLLREQTDLSDGAVSYILILSNQSGGRGAEEDDCICKTAFALTFLVYRRSLDQYTILL